MPRLRCVPNVRAMRRERDPRTRAWRYELRWRVGARTFHRVQWLASDAAALEYIQKESGTDPSSITWPQLLERWKTMHAALSPRYVSKLELTVREALKAGLLPRVSQASRQEVSRFLAGRGASRAGKDLRHLGTLARWAVDQGLLDVAPFAGLRAPPHKPKARIRIRPADLPALIQDLPEDLLAPVLWIMLTGCRAGEACGLSRDDLQPDGAALRVKGGHRLQYALDGPLRAVLAAADHYASGRSRRASAVFLTRTGRAWSVPELDHRVAEVWPAGVTLHCLRHMWGTEAGRRYGADMVQAVLGHKSRASAIPYVHTAEDEDARAEGGAAIRATILPQITAAAAVRGLNGLSPNVRQKRTANACPHCGKTIDSKTLRSMLKGAKDMPNRSGRVAERQTQRL